ncbi:carboxylesterase [Polynucleobacter meluiroseus]|uniref:Carboxylesterase n=1 Tax=Polynucleobacter meluiroseus TaxID=1938814 RepID=A0A240E056_9BURK|nr:alpha/beta fold hydrolase [Polynucleobacter meluiroseus]SNX28582.1 carboxylesterase [Polynucleobacter meluiroseus]
MTTEPNTAPFEAFYQGSSNHAVIMLPGLCGSELEMGVVPRLLRQSQHTLAIPRIPGYSAHTGLTGFASWVDYVDHLVVDLLKTHLSVSLVGLSMGATLALAVAEQNEQIESVVLLSTVLAFDGWAMSWYHPLLSVAYSLGFRNWHYMEKEPFGVKNPDLRRRIQRSVEANKVSELGAAHLPARHLYESAGLAKHVIKNLKNIHANLLIIHSIDDETASPKNVDIILELAKSEIKKVIWLGNCYHMITVDNEREIVANETSNFINQMHEQSLLLEKMMLKNPELVIKLRER